LNWSVGSQLQVGGVYHQGVHASLLKPPAAAVLHAGAKHFENPKIPKHFFWISCQKWRLIRRDGIQMFNIHYWDNVLSPLAGRSSKPV
jgi:putative transposase